MRRGNPPRKRVIHRLHDQTVIFAQVAGMLLARLTSGICRKCAGRVGRKAFILGRRRVGSRGNLLKSRWAGPAATVRSDLTLPPWQRRRLSIWPSVRVFAAAKCGLPLCCNGCWLTLAGSEISYRRVSELTRPVSCYGLEYYFRRNAALNPRRNAPHRWQRDAMAGTSGRHLYSRELKRSFFLALTRPDRVRGVEISRNVKHSGERIPDRKRGEYHSARLTVTVTMARSLVFDGQDHLPPPLPKFSDHRFAKPPSVTQAVE